MKRLTSFKFSGSIQTLYTVEDETDITSIPEGAISIGGGSNIIIFPTIQSPLLKVSPQFLEPEYSDGLLTCSAGMPVSSILKWMIKHNLSGLEFAAGVPATIGGMVYMNFECWGNSMSSMVSSVLVYEHGKGCQWIMKNDYQAGYRWTSFHEQPCTILAVTLHVVPSDEVTIKHQIAANLNKRKKTQPILKSTFGSVFKNPSEKKAWELVEACDLKGVAIGDVRVSTVHANFFENQSHATVNDALALINHIQNTVHSMYNIHLECEVQIIQ